MKLIISAVYIGSACIITENHLEALHSLMQATKTNRLILEWVIWHQGIKENEEADIFRGATAPLKVP